jgi:lipid-binding SYLF domain-containing protein
MLSSSKRAVLSAVSALLLISASPLVLAQDASKDVSKDEAKAAKDRAEIDADAAAILKEFRGMKGADTLYNKAAGYAVFKVTKAGLGASGAGGGGLAVDKKSGKKTYMRMGSAGVGLTFGVSRYDIVILFETAEKFNAFVKGGWDSSATAQAAAGTKGAEVGSTFFEGVAYYQISKKGLMASADVSGTKFWVDDLNQK